MMKFVLKNVKNGCRQGVLSEFGNHPDTRIDTPFCMLFTRGGCVPHLSGDVLKKMDNIPSVAHIPINLLAEHCSSVEKGEQSIGEFTAMKDFITYCSLHDPATLVKSGYNDKTGIALWSKGGKLKMDTESFIKIQETFQPDFYQALSDGDTDINSVRKRCVKVVDRTLSFLDSIIEAHNKSPRLKNTAIFACLVGGYNEKERIRCAKETSTRPVQGFVMDGFFPPGPKSESFRLSQCQDILQQVMENLPDDKPRLMQSIWPPDSVIEAVEMGIDIFDSSYPYVVTERNSALCFVYTLPHLELEEQTSTESLEINLKDKQYFEDFSPLVKQCTCYTCTNFTRSYIHHLINTTELLSSILLMIHNFHHYFKFFESLRKNLADDKLQELKKLISKQNPNNTVDR